MPFEYEQKFLIALLLTIIIEIIVALLLVKFFYKEKEIKTSKVIFTGFIASALTLPYFWFILPIYISNRSLYIIIGEVSIVLIEALIYQQFLGLKFMKAFTVSLLANIASILLGLIIS